MVRACVLLAVTIAFAACGTYGSEDAPPPNEDAGVPDAGVDATDAAVAPDDGFILTVAPEHVVVDPGDTIVSIQVTLTRGRDFSGSVDVKLNQLPAMAGITSVNPLVIEGDATSGPIAFAISSAATNGEYPIEVRGESGTKSSDSTLPGSRQRTGLADLANSNALRFFSLLSSFWKAGAGATTANASVSAISGDAK